MKQLADDATPRLDPLVMLRPDRFGTPMETSQEPRTEASPATTTLRGVRVLLITGKGGVGKTTVAGATAATCAARGTRTLVVSTDAAHSLADAFGRPIGPAPTKIAPSLWAQQLDGRHEVERSWTEIREYLAELLAWAGGEGLAAEELLVVPGMQEVFALENILEQAESGNFDRIVVDCAPSAETLRLLELPEILATYVDRLFPRHRRFARLSRPVLRRTVDMPLATDLVFAAFERFMSRLASVAALLTDPQVTTVRIVATPERMVIDEAKRLYSHLALFGYFVDSVIVNRELPTSEVGTPLLDAWHDRQRRLLTEIEEAFAHTEIQRLELLASEPLGIERLRSLGTDLYGSDDPGAVTEMEQPIRYEEHAGHVELRMRLPGVSSEEVEVLYGDGELIINAGSERRALLLPDALRGRRAAGAEHDGAELRIAFHESTRVVV